MNVFDRCKMKYSIIVNESKLCYYLIDTKTCEILQTHKNANLLYEYALTLQGMNNTAELLNSKLKQYSDIQNLTKEYSI